MNQENFKKLLEDEAFVQELVKAEDVSAVQKLLEEKGFSFTEAELVEIGELSEKVARGEVSLESLEAQQNDELSEDDLENVAGGSITVGAVLGVAFTCFCIYSAGRSIVDGMGDIVERRGW